MMKKILVSLFILILYSEAFGIDVHIYYPKACLNYERIKAYGKIETNENVTIFALVSGNLNIDSSFLNVKKGQLIAQIYPYRSLQQLQNAKANAKAAYKNLKETIKLQKMHMATSQEVEKAKMLHYSAKNQLEMLKVELEQSKIYAPFSGELKYLVYGKIYITKNQPIAILKGSNRLWIKAYIASDYIDRLIIGQIIYYYLNGVKHRGTIAQISHNADFSGLVPILININNKNKNLVTGQWVDLDIPIFKKTSFCVPKEAIASKGSKTYVYIILNGIAYKKYVDLVNISGHTAYISGYIDKNTPIAISAVDRLKNNTKVKIIK